MNFMQKSSSSGVDSTFSEKEGTLRNNVSYLHCKAMQAFFGKQMFSSELCFMII
jgi:hypothetical protein